MSGLECDTGTDKGRHQISAKIVDDAKLSCALDQAPETPRPASECSAPLLGFLLRLCSALAPRLAIPRLQT
jgi:hypothetical protein